RHRPKWVALATDSGCRDGLPPNIECLTDRDGEVIRRIQSTEVDLVVSAMVGAAGLEYTWAALEAGKTVALANKETLAVAGPLVMELAREGGGRIIPVDSEHSAIFQLIDARPAGLERIVLTGSGGPFRGWDIDRLRFANVDQALSHPTWKMGPKITVDSA